VQPYRSKGRIPKASRSRWVISGVRSSEVVTRIWGESRRGQDAMQADAHGGGALAAEMGGAGAAEQGQPLAGHAGPQPRPGEGTQELGADRPPAGGVVDEQARATRGPAGRQHYPVAVQIQLVTGQLSDPVEQLVTAQARVADQLVEVFHEQGLVQHREALKLDRAVAEGAGLGEPPAR
jgi:hypothetical protein